MNISEDLRTVPVEGFPLALLAVTLTLLVLVIFAVAVRMFVVIYSGTIGLDDYLITLGAIIKCSMAGLTYRGVTVGIGTFNKNLNDWLSVQASKIYTIWILVYLCAMVMIKTSICITLLRILPHGPRKSLTNTLRLCTWTLIGLTCAAWCVSFIGILTLCRPIQASWDKSLVATGKAQCGSQEALIGISQTVTATGIITDFGCTILPGIMLWKSPMGQSFKIQILFLLSVASVACVATIARAPYITRYANPHDDLLYYIGYMVLFSNIETGVGLVASSLPALRRMKHMLKGPAVTKQPSEVEIDQSKGSVAFVTIGGTAVNSGGRSVASPSRKVFSKPTIRGRANETGEDVDGQGWERLG
ncbi:hypothetical protein PgNI_10361 [Pyricularia grisea]|uniref:Rhodopsin domain-containing protein n=1 Tax=Pyricularia grisea TaxID=148305 RepID=A0A6P8AY86_PYRGI|nr:hypothetical protein PgNI_10361 [Pyricularia grisea]TLD07246.1 hypothetical protein PgNI_10361 [Pyricularia grisea]